VQAAKSALVGKTIQSGQIMWKENVRQWHPGQDWVFEPGGMGVFDPGVNALSIMTEVLPKAVHLKEAMLHTPSNRQTPIQAEMVFSSDVRAEFDWLQDGTQVWEQRYVATDGTTVDLLDGGNRCVVDGVERPVNDLGEYPALYARMADLVQSGRSDVDLTPMVHVSDIMTLGQRVNTSTFDW
ncbi:MAG: gfo/Idh/MocA family oxidoreductase, partial [Yoonia sp.]